MTSIISNKINSIFNKLKSLPYTGDLHTHHFSIAIRQGKMISPVSCNYFRTYVFGKIRGTMHAEMGTLNYILNSNKSISSPYNHRLKQCVLQPKGTK